MVDKHVPHHLGRDREEVSAILPRHVPTPQKPDEGFLDQGGRLHGMVAFPPDMTTRHTIQFGADQRQQPIERRAVALTPAGQQPRDIAGLGPHAHRGLKMIRQEDSRKDFQDHGVPGPEMSLQESEGVDMMAMRLHAASVVSALLATLGLGAGAQRPHGTAAIPPTWDEGEVERHQVPLADFAASPKHVTADYYYRMPVRPIYKSYPVYAPGREPPGYMEWLEEQEPVVLWDDQGHAPPLQT